jgi:hypothetical protein
LDYFLHLCIKLKPRTASLLDFPVGSPFQRLACDATPPYRLFISLRSTPSMDAPNCQGKNTRKEQNINTKI